MVMNELRFVAACLEGEGVCFPSTENDEKSAVERRKNAQDERRKRMVNERVLRITLATPSLDLGK